MDEELTLVVGDRTYMWRLSDSDEVYRLLCRELGEPDEVEMGQSW